MEQAGSMDVQESGSVAVAAEVVPRPTWRDALVARLRPADHHVTDDDVYAILNGTDDAATAELCAAKGVTLPMYCVWKRKYLRLTLDQVRAERRGERRRRYTAIGASMAAAVMVAGVVAVAAARAVVGSMEVAAQSPPVRVAALPEPAPIPRQQTAAVEARPASAARVAPAAPVSAPKAAAPRHQATPDDVPAVVETGYRIQVTAADNLEEGRAMVARLTSAGYPAYMTRATIGTSNVFRVRVGPFETLAAAEEAASRLRTAGYAGAWIAR